MRCRAARREEELPVYARLGGPDLANGRANLAITLLTRNSPGDREEALRPPQLAGDATSHAVKA